MASLLHTLAFSLSTFLIISRMDIEKHTTRPHTLDKALTRRTVLYVLYSVVLVYIATSFSKYTFDREFPLVATSGVSEEYSKLILHSLETNNVGKLLYDYTRDNQLAGTNLKMVNYTLEKYKELGLQDAIVDEYTAYISYPLNQSVVLFKDNEVKYVPSLQEDTLKEDPNSYEKVPAFLGYAGNGNVTAEYVYCNYGTFEDFNKLEESGVLLKGKIAIVRYGKIFRGLKVKFAQDHGMAAVVIYTDTYDDGEVIVENGFDAYPNGPARNPSAIQRGSSQFLSVIPGDPTTPGYAIKPGEDLPREDPFISTPRIPAIPMSFKEIQPILSKLSGHGPKIDSWEDGLVKDFDYSVGPNPKYTLNVYNKQDFNISTMHNIMGKIKGKDDSKFILVGNHHDSWTPAAADPHSGSAAVLEVIRAFRDLSATGWEPRVSIVFASWDGEEYGLIGSTEFAEYYSWKLKKECIAYLNTDVASVGSILSIQSSPLLNHVLLESAKQIPYPNSTISLYDHFFQHHEKIGTLGSGSDYTVFLEHLGIPSADMGFSNDLKTAPVFQYHSLYDSYHWMSEFADPGFVFHNLLAKFLALTTLHLSTEPVIPFRTGDYAIALSEYYDNLDIPDQWNFDHVDKCHHHNSTELLESVKAKLDELKTSSAEFDVEIMNILALYEKWDSLTYWQRIKLHFRAKGVNSILQYFERHLLYGKGLNERPWFKHFAYASGRYTGYKGQELPFLAEAIEDLDRKDFFHALRHFNGLLSTLIRMTTL